MEGGVQPSGCDIRVIKLSKIDFNLFLYSVMETILNERENMAVMCSFWIKVIFYLYKKGRRWIVAWSRGPTVCVCGVCVWRSGASCRNPILFFATRTIRKVLEKISKSWWGKRIPDKVSNGQQSAQKTDLMFLGCLEA